MKIGKTKIKGEEVRASGGDTHAKIVQTDEFILERGAVLLEVKHKGSGEFILKIVPTEGWNETEATIATTGAILATSFATGVAIGSIFPGLGTLVRMGIGAVSGGFLGGKVGDFIGEKIGDEFRFAKWEHDGELDDYIVTRVCDQDKTSYLWPGKHKLEVKAAGRWSVHLIQPELGQASESIVSDEIEEPFEEFVGEGHYVLPPMIAGNKPVIGKAQHKGRAGFSVYATSVDGIQRSPYLTEKGSSLRKDRELILFRGKSISWRYSQTANGT